MAIPVKLEVFEGPLDLLLYLIEKNKVNIYDIPIVTITEQYMEYVRQLQSTNNLDIISEFLVMAATLLKIKSKMLLPKVEVEEDEEDIDPRQELVERLLEYKKFKYISDELKDKQFDAEKILFKVNTIPPELKDIKEEVNIDELLDGLTLSKLHLVFKTIIKRQEDKIDPIRSKFGRIEKEEVNLSDKIRFIDTYGAKNKRFSFKKLLEGQHDKIEIIVTFLGILELIKMGRIHVVQEEIFDDIYIDYQETNEELDVEELSFA
ncbi:MAG: segregation/condensation protein A [Lachnospiraceae bacterium]|nr:segregation/condensation protein A [Lachnospiraceae bacterium]